VEPDFEKRHAITDSRSIVNSSVHALKTSGIRHVSQYAHVVVGRGRLTGFAIWWESKEGTNVVYAQQIVSVSVTYHVYKQIILRLVSLGVFM